MIIIFGAVSMLPDSITTMLMIIGIMSIVGSADGRGQQHQHQ
ncbi:hypothetical protein FBZ93_11666 [Bradyrhizobium macuxiense]|uniref:Uncharacterized protein n=1 Tax=Bradyrhizobium macuxiense TaxID=1755647 RepID=A0A560L1D4_9BRAD|nr:hypothetical protein [Bradyrhizobium macuxiense]TWB89351.1 hypothetical protein FBZ93_11666 [Bradyrhizobium macuxiense]